MDSKYFIQGKAGSEYIMYGNEVESVYIGKSMSHTDSVEMIERLNDVFDKKDKKDSNEVLTELKEWLSKGCLSVKRLYDSAAGSDNSNEMNRLSEKYRTMQMVLNKINELEKENKNC